MSLTKTKNLFSEELLEKLHARTREGQQPTTTNFFGWGAKVIGSSNAIFAFEITDELKQRVAEELINKNIFKQVPKIWTVNIYLMSRHSFIPWHDDDAHKFTCTVWLNKQWPLDLGGYFVYKEGGEIKALAPEYNTGVYFAPPIEHACTLTALNAPLRESLQIFVYEE